MCLALYMKVNKLNASDLFLKDLFVHVVEDKSKYTLHI